MRKIIVKVILIFFVFNLYSYDGEEIVENTNDADYKIGELQRELDILKRDVEEIKNKNLWFSFNFEGSTKTIFGAALWTRDGVTLNKNFPVTLGFDFENNIRMGMDIANKVVASNSYKSVEGTEISAKLKINSNGLRRIKPEGSYYVMDATDDQGRKVKVYFPRYSGSSSNIVFGNFEVIFEEAKIKNIMGTGVFISYKDVFEVQQYYGVTSLVDVLKLNHKYFNNGFNGNDNDVLYYSFDDRYYQPEAVESVAVRYWSENTLFTNPSNSDANQNPHGISLGYEGKISDGVEAYVEGGGASKDAFDPKYFVDEQIDAGFFLKGSIHFHNKKFSFHPKLAFSFAFQTGTLEDKAPATGYSTFSFGTIFPLFFKLPSGKEDYVRFDTSFNLNAHFATSSVAGILTIVPEFKLLNKKLFFELPFIYSFKTKEGGFIRVGNESVKWLDQEAEDHIINLGLGIGFDSTNLFGDYFQFIIKEKLYFLYNAIKTKPEVFLYQIFRNEFVFNDVGPKKLTLYYEVGYGYAKDPRMVSSNYFYDSEVEKWFDKTTYKEVTIDHSRRWLYNVSVLSLETGFDMEIMKNLSFGISVESPKLLLGSDLAKDGMKTVGTQNSFGMFKIWSELKL